MPRQPRQDAPGTRHHVMGRGTEAGKIFRTRDAGMGMFLKAEEGFVEPQWASWGIRRRPWPVARGDHLGGGAGRPGGITA
jgi:hypothetical protein